MQKVILAISSGKHFKLETGNLETGSFNGGEVSLTVKEGRNDLKDKEVFVVGSTNSPGENIIEMFFTLDTLSRMGISKVAAVIPYFAYSRADREKFPGESVSAETICKILETTGGPNLKIITVDLHSERINSFLKNSIININAWDLFADKFKNLADLTSLGPDHSALSRATSFAKSAGISKIAFLEKERLQNGNVVINGIKGEITKKVVIVDDMVDSAWTILNGIEFLKDKNIEEIYVVATHMVWNGGGYLRLANSNIIKKIFTTDSIKPPDNLPKKIEVVSIASLLKQTINI